MYSLIIVDDEDITRIAIRNYIQKTQQDFIVKGTFSNGMDALNYLRDNPVNIVITDIRMPGMNGLDLSEYISKHHPETIIMIISGYGEFEYARKAINYGVSTYLLKPLDFTELTQNLTLAKEKITTLQTDTDYQEEDIQLFFTDLIGGMLTGIEELNRRFATLTLTGKPSDYNGCLMTITLEKNETLSHWNYGREKLATALLNGIRMALTEYQCFHLFRSGMRYFFIILSTEKVPIFSLEMLNNILHHLLHCSCELKIQTTFTSIEELVVIPSVNESEKSLPDNVTSGDNKPAVSMLSSANNIPSDNDDIIIQRAISYIQSHYFEDLTREDVADAVFLSSAYFSRFFKQKTGMNFIDYLTTVRMQKAAELLTTNAKVNDIAKQVGYQSRNRFFINFRQYSGYSPTEYRRQILKLEEYNEDTEE